MTLLSTEDAIFDKSEVDKKSVMNKTALARKYITSYLNLDRCVTNRFILRMLRYDLILKVNGDELFKSGTIFGLKKNNGTLSAFFATTVSSSLSNHGTGQ